MVSKSSQQQGWRASWAVLGVAAIVVVALIAGVVLLVVGRSSDGPAKTTPSAAPTSHQGGSGLQAQENAIANRPMLKGSGITRQAEVNATTDPLALPPSTTMVAGLVKSGYPRTPAGAVAQLAALEKAGYQDFDEDTGRQVYQAFALPGAVPINDWVPTATVLHYFEQNPDQDPAQMSATYQPIQGLIKGTADQGRFVVACTIGRLTYSTAGDSQQVGAPDCVRMQWDSGHWMIAPGHSPADPTWTWPRSAESYRAGFRDLTGDLP